MKPISDRFEITQGAREADGTPIEPEAAPVRRVVEVEQDAAATAGMPGTPLPLRTALVTEMAAIEAAEVAAEVCHRCEHYRRDLWPALRRRMEADPDGRAQLDRVRGSMLDVGAAVLPTPVGDRLDDVEHTLNLLGVCTALTELTGQPQVVHPEASCPSSVPNCFKLAGRGAAKTAAAARDTVLKTAEGSVGKIIVGSR